MRPPPTLKRVRPALAGLRSSAVQLHSSLVVPGVAKALCFGAGGVKSLHMRFEWKWRRVRVGSYRLTTWDPELGWMPSNEEWTIKLMVDGRWHVRSPRGRHMGDTATLDEAKALVVARGQQAPPAGESA